MIKMFGKKVKAPTTEEIAIAERNELTEQVRKARDVLTNRVRSALAHNRLLQCLPETSKEYKDTQYELVQVKQDVVAWMHTYTMCVHDLNEFCEKNNLRAGAWVSAQQIALWATEERK